MNNETTPHAHDYEAKLNPPPKVFRVSLGIKISFLLTAMLGISTYCYFIHKKRGAEQAFIAKQLINAQEPTILYLPEVVGKDVESNAQVTLSSLKNSWVLLNIWATWCPSCQAEMPSLELLQRKLQGQLLVCAVSVDDDMDVIITWKKLHLPSFRVLWDQEKQLPRLFNLTKYPETFLVAPDGRVIKQFSGPRDWSSSIMIEYLLNTIKMSAAVSPK